MRILPYESAAVKVRVEAYAVKSGLFLVPRCKEGVCRGVSAAEPQQHPGPSMCQVDAMLAEEGLGIGKVCAKSRTRISDTDL